MSALSDLQAELAATPGAIPGTFGSFTAIGILGVASETFTTQSGLAVIQGQTWTWVYANPDFPGLQSSSVITIATFRYAVRHIDIKADGLHSKAFMERLP